MATIKKAQSGTKVKKPTYKNLRMGVANQSKAEGRDYTEVATKKDSSEYKKGFVRGIKKDKESRNDISEVEKQGRWEGLNTKKNGGPVKKAKNGKSFPDLNKDGKVTKADILKGRGVIAKSGTTIKKAQNGTVTPYEKSVKTSKQVGVRGNDLFRVDSAGKVLEKATNPKQKSALRSKQTKDSTSTMNSRNRMADSANKISISNTIKKIGSRGLKNGGKMKKKCDACK